MKLEHNPKNKTVRQKMVIFKRDKKVLAAIQNTQYSSRGISERKRNHRQDLQTCGRY